MAHSQFRLLTLRRFAPIFVTQALGAFNDNVFKAAVIILITYKLADRIGLDAQLIGPVATGIFILPLLPVFGDRRQAFGQQGKNRI